MNKTVITYRGAYIARRIDLCEQHANDDDAGMSLGPVEHGAHPGRCAVCDALAQHRADAYDAAMKRAE